MLNDVHVEKSNFNHEWKNEIGNTDIGTMIDCVFTATLTFQFHQAFISFQRSKCVTALFIGHNQLNGYTLVNINVNASSL